MGIQNGFNGTRLFLFNGKDNISSAEFQDIDAFRNRYIKISLFVCFSTFTYVVS